MTPVAVALAGLAFSGSCIAQPPAEHRPEPAPMHVEGDDAEQGAEAMRERLTRALRELEEQRDRLRAALERLEKGDNPIDIRRDLDASREGGPAGPDDRPGPRRGDERRLDRRPLGGPGGEPQAQRPMGPGRLGRPADGPPPHRPGGPGGPAGSSPEEDRRRLMEVVRKEMPDFAARLDSLREKHPQLADRMFARIGPRVRDALQARDRDPELFRLRMEEVRGGLEVLEAIHALQQAKRSDDGDANARQAAARLKVRELLAANFEHRLKVQERDAQLLSERVEKLRAAIGKRRAGREGELDEMLERIDRGEGPLHDDR